ncbi:MAG: glycosyltransferase family 4 protein [Anaerolineae bacterium]|nr:glycosyltransferase family 4 protein [Anaerolineae bacterium]
MHLVINATEVGRGRGGNEQYIMGLIEGLAQLKPDIQVSLLTCDWGVPLNLPSIFPQVCLGPYRRLPFFLWQQTRVLRRLGADWYLANFFMPPILPCQSAVAVHDMSFAAHPEYFPRTIAWYMYGLTCRAVRQARWVLTGSEFSRQEILRFYKLTPEKVILIYDGVSAIFRPFTEAEQEAPDACVRADRARLAEYGVDGDYIFALGNIHPRKNLGRLLDAYVSLQQHRNSMPPMVWGGTPRWESHSLLARAREAGVFLPGFIAQEDLPCFYRQAIMLVYPSLYEGFGLPPVEAMACGTPVITSKVSSLPEVVGEAALTVDPFNTDEIAHAMARLLDDSALRAHLRTAGIARAAQFTWRRTAEGVITQLMAAG